MNDLLIMKDRQDRQRSAYRGRLTAYAMPKQMGVISWNPKKWGMTEAEAHAYDVAEAKREAELRQIEYEADQASPGFLDTLTQTAQGASKSAGSATTFLIWAAALGLVGWGASELLAERGPTIAYKIRRKKTA